MNIARRPFKSAPVQTGPRANEQIDVPEVRLIGSDGTNHDIVSIERALEIAYDEGLDLVEISPNTKPPVCKILDHGKFKYQAQKKAAEARKKQKVIDVKEVKMRPNIDTHDYDVKIRNARRFIDNGDKVKVTIRFRGREMAHQNLGMQLLIRVKDELSDVTKVELHPKMEGRQMIMILAPKV
ncbi:MAG TPA: translation initiation factor IF-3 [Rhizobiales bacterium]|nr:translation initiation factor IF-3 [Hyphomicrobiales bacterium]